MCVQRECFWCLRRRCSTKDGIGRSISPHPTRPPFICVDSGWWCSCEQPASRWCGQFSSDKCRRSFSRPGCGWIDHTLPPGRLSVGLMWGVVFVTHRARVCCCVQAVASQLTWLGASTLLGYGCAEGDHHARRSRQPDHRSGRCTL